MAPTDRAVGARDVDDTKSRLQPTASVTHTAALSLVREHAHIALLMTFNLVMMDNNNVFMYFLLVQTSAGCAYHDDGGAYVKSQTLTLVAVFAFRPLTSFVTDRLPNRNHGMLLAAAVLELTGLLAMLLLVALSPPGSLSPWPILALSVFKQCAEVQINNSIYKIFKIRLANKCLLDTCDAQCTVIATVGIAGEALELLVNLVAAGAAYALIVRGATFDAVKYFYFGVTLAGNLACIGLALRISADPAEYYTKPLLDSVHRANDDDDDDDDNVNDAGVGVTDDDAAVSAAASVNPGFADTPPPPPTERAPLLAAKGGEGSRRRGGCGSAVRAAVGIASAPVALGAMAHMFLTYAAQELLYDVQSLAVPGAHISSGSAANATAEDFCSGYITNTVFQGVFENAAYAVGTVFFVAVLRRAKPHVFYGRLFPAVMAALLGVSVFLSRPETGQLELALSMEAVVAFTYFFFLYSKYLSTAAIDAEWYGFYSFLVGSMQSIVDLAIYFAMEESVSNRALLVCMYAFMGASVLFSLGFAWTQRRRLTEAVYECQVP